MFNSRSIARYCFGLWILLTISRATGQSFQLISTLSPGSTFSKQAPSSNGANPRTNSSGNTIFQASKIEPRPLPPIVVPGLAHKDTKPRKGFKWNSITDQPDVSGLLIDRSDDHGTPQNVFGDDTSEDAITHNVSNQALHSRALPTLRILPLGASITWGAGSTDGNGYRYGLRGALVKDGYTVNMIGSVNHGSMADNQVEGWPGAIISDIIQKVELSLPSRPNVVIIQVGSNDMSTNTDPPGAAARMGVLVDKILAAVPESTIIVSGLMPMSNEAAEKLSVEVYNPGLRQMVQDKFNAGKSVYFIDMHTGYITLSDLSDGLHPNDGGFMKMARLYYDTIVRVTPIIKPVQPVSGVDDGGAPNDVGGPIDTKCQMDPTNAIAPVLTQQGSGETDGPYVHKGVDRGTIFTWSKTTNPTQTPNLSGIFWADLNGDGNDDLLYIPVNFRQYELHISQGSGRFAAPILVNTNIDCPTAAITFADSNDNGYDDLFCVDSSGNLRIWQNVPLTISPLTTSWIGSMNVDMAAKAGFPQARVRIADIDGDGRADYLVIRDNGDIEGWRNSGVLPTVESWQSLGVVSSGKSFPDLQGIRFVDLNGDGRDDLLWMTDGGQVTTYINQRGFSSGSIAPSWMPGIITHGGPGTAGTRAKITFGRVYTPSTGNSDYIQASATGLQLYENQGSGGRTVAGDGVYYCDMTGDGADDYIYVSPSGTFTLFGNLRSPPSWQQYGVIYSRTISNRKQLHIADWNGDGRCDILFVDKFTGQVTMARNDGFVNGKLTFWEYGLVSSTATCNQGYGSAYGDLGVRFAHISGKPRVDYLCIQKNGVTTGYFNRGLGDMVDIGQIKAGVGTDRANIRYADVNGDGRADFLWVDRFTGETQVWTNEGEDPSRPAGSAYRWQLRGVAANGGLARGANIFWANIRGQGRADQIIDDPATNRAQTYYNVCPIKPGPPPPLPAGPQRRK